MASEPTSRQHSGLLPFFLLTFLITWGVAAFLFLFPNQFKALFGTLTAASPIFVLAVAAPTISATIITYILSRGPGLRALYARIVQWRFGVQWYALVIVGLPLLGFIVSRVTPAHPQYDVSTPAMVILLLLKELILGPLGEELGWRGFALPRLLQRFNPFVASLILGVIWGVWHLPALFVSTLPQGQLAIPSFLFFALCLSFLVTWLYLHTGRSVLIAVLFHLMINMALDAFGTSLPALGAVITVWAVLVIALDRSIVWFGPPKPEPAAVSVRAADS